MRIWEMQFQVVQALKSLPEPNEIVLEKQDNPGYHIEEALRHGGQDAQIVCTLEGEGSFRHNQEIWKLTPGMAFLDQVGDPGTSYYYPGHADGPWVFLWMSFRGPHAVQLIGELAERYGRVFELPLDRGFVRHLEGYRTQRGSLQMISPTAGAKIVHDALSALGETLEGELSTSPQACLTRDAQELIKANLDRSLDLSLIAEKLHVTREHLSRVFHSQTGISPGVFAARERMRAASRMLMDNRMTCKEIGMRLGYDSPSSFARAFKAHYSISPAEYKQQGGFQDQSIPEDPLLPSDPCRDFH